MSTEHYREKNNCQLFAVIVATVMTSISAYILFSIQNVLPKFRPLFDGFGSELPHLTEFALTNYAWGWLFPILGLLACWYLFATLSAKISYMKTAFVVSVLAFAASFIWRDTMIMAIYLPIFKMGQVI